MTKYKGIPLEQWKSDRMLERLTDAELAELHVLMLCEFWDAMESFVGTSDFYEANIVINEARK